MAKKLYRSRYEKVFGGVCGGLGRHFDIDPVIVRIIWVFSAVIGGVGLLAYIIAWIIVPQEPLGDNSPNPGAGS